MLPRHPGLPRFWLMTDERIGDDLWRALAALPPGGGVVFRHHATPLHERRALFGAVAKIARRRRLTLVVAGRERLGHAAGVHGTARRLPGEIRTWPAHSRVEALAGIRAGAALLFVSPVFATRSHPGAPALGPRQAMAIVHGLPVPAIALGGVTARRFGRLRGFHGWAAIDAWAAPAQNQKRKAVPI